MVSVCCFSTKSVRKERGELMAAKTTPEVKQLRLVIEAVDFEEVVAFYRDTLGLAEEFYVESEGNAMVMALQAGRATLEIVNPAQRRLIDRLEVGREVSRNIRVAFEVTDGQAATDRLVSAGAELIAPPTRTPWNSLNSRLEAPAGLQITLFEELDQRDPTT
jgi:predicted enzyme related to lactoylglutathione lyase